MRVTDYEPYSACTAHSIPLRRPAVLYREGFEFTMRDGLQEARDRSHHMQNPNREFFAALPSGTLIALRKVTRIKDFEGGGFKVDAFGSVSVPGETKPVEFHYSWGYNEISRAPWEDDSVPALRPAGYYGRKMMPAADNSR